MSIPRTDASILRGVNVLAVVEWTAFFSAYIVMGVYLVEVAGFDDVGAGWAAGAFGLGLCLLPSGRRVGETGPYHSPRKECPGCRC